MSDEIELLAFERSGLPASAVVATTPDERKRLLSALLDGAREALLLVTCERLELYARGARPGVVLSRLASGLGVRACDLETLLVAKSRRFPEQHLLRVAAGLESRLVGEPQIQGQVRAAFLEAEAAGAIGPVLGALGRAAIHAGKRVRAETGLGRAPSLVALTLARLSEELGGLHRRSVAVVGTGSLAAEITTALRAAGAGRLLVASRTPERAADLAARVRGVAVREEDIDSERAIDAVVACTNHRVALHDRRRLVIDLGVPPNVDPGPRVVRLSDLTAESRASRPAEVRAAEALVALELQRFARWRAARREHARKQSREAA